MKTKAKDEKYCGVREQAIINAKPVLYWGNVYHFKTLVIDRYRVHKRKDVKGLDAPWTKNPIIKEFKFTNVRREHDRQTMYLINNITNNPNLTLEDKIVNSFLFRAWNNWSTLCSFGFPYPAQTLYQKGLKDEIRTKYELLKRQDPNRLWYSNAYNQGGTKCAWKFLDGNKKDRPYKFGKDLELGDDKYPDYEPEIPLRPFHVGVWLGEDDIVNKLLEANNQQEAFEVIKSVRGFADFLAYQVFVDLSYIPEFPFSENEFVVAGPGCKKGLDYIFLDRDGMTYEESIFWLRNQINKNSGGWYSLFDNPELEAWCMEHDKVDKKYTPEVLFSDLSMEDRCMNVMSIENCMCELSKYIRAAEGTGRPRNKYKPFVETKDIDRYPGETEDILKKIREAGE
jgi:hypothetical protein